MTPPPRAPRSSTRRSGAFLPQKFAGFPKVMAVRPSQIRASAAESALMVPDAFAAGDTYSGVRCTDSGLKMPVSIIAGEDDRLVNAEVQSSRLHHEIPLSKFDRVHSAGHMVHQTATNAVMSAIEEVTSLDGPLRKPEAA